MIRLISLLTAGFLATAAPADPLLTGVVEDVNAQTIEMPSLPGSWQRQVEWMAPEGSLVKAGDVVVRIEPGDLIAQEEQARTDLEKARLSAERRIGEVTLGLLEARRGLAQAESDVRLAKLDAVIPASTIPRLDYERYQLTLETAEKALVRAQAEVLNREAELSGDVRYYFGLPVVTGDVRWRVTREPVYPRWWYWWYPSASSQSQVVAAGHSGCHCGNTLPPNR